MALPRDPAATALGEENADRGGGGTPKRKMSEGEGEDRVENGGGELTIASHAKGLPQERWRIPIEELADKLAQFPTYFPPKADEDEDDKLPDFWSASTAELKMFADAWAGTLEPVDFFSLSQGEAECFVRGLCARADSEAASSASSGSSGNGWSS